MRHTNSQPTGLGRSLARCLAFCAAAILIGIATTPWAQDKPEKPGVAGPRTAEAEDEALKDSDLEDDPRFANGAALKTDPELERLLKRAEQFVRDGRFDLATILWQKVLDESGDTLMLQRRPAPGSTE